MEEAGYDMLDRDLGVAIYCLYSGGIPTPQRLVYNSASPGFTDAEPDVELGDGDGTVNARSLEACRRWQDVQGQHKVNVTFYGDIEHNKLLHHRPLIDDIIQVAQRAAD